MTASTRATGSISGSTPWERSIRAAQREPASLAEEEVVQPRSGCRSTRTRGQAPSQLQAPLSRSTGLSVTDTADTRQLGHIQAKEAAQPTVMRQQPLPDVRDGFRGKAGGGNRHNRWHCRYSPLTTLTERERINPGSVNDRSPLLHCR